jgi:hypothetical protein
VGGVRQSCWYWGKKNSWWKRKCLSVRCRDATASASQDMLVLSSTAASRFCNCCTDGRTSPGNYEYPLVCTDAEHKCASCIT